LSSLKFEFIKVSYDKAVCMCEGSNFVHSFITGAKKVNHLLADGFNLLSVCISGVVLVCISMSSKKSFSSKWY